MEFESEFEKNLFELRQAKLLEIEKLGQAVYPNRFPAKQGETAISLAEVRARWDKATGEELEANAHDRGCCRAHHGDSRPGQGRLCHAAAGGRAAADLCAA
jgi:hypothetical protein